MRDTLKQLQFEMDLKTRTSIFGTFKTGDHISVSLIQRRCSTGYHSASRVFENLIEDGLVEMTEINNIAKML